MASNDEDLCTSHADFAVLCSFIDQFGEKLGFTLPNIGELQSSLEDTDNGKPIRQETVLNITLWLWLGGRPSLVEPQQEKQIHNITRLKHSYIYTTSPPPIVTPGPHESIRLVIHPLMGLAIPQTRVYANYE